MKEIKINQNDANQRLDKFLMKTFPKLGKSMMYKAIRNKKIKVNRKRCTFDQKIQENDSILLFLPPDVLEEKKVETNYISSKLDVIYEDENILIVNKPYGLLSQSDQRQNQDCLVNRVQAYLMEKNEYDPNKEHSFAPSICHRLDRNTTGLVIAAKKCECVKKSKRGNRKSYDSKRCIEPMLWVLLNKRILLCAITFAKKIQLRR